MATLVAYIQLLGQGKSAELGRCVCSWREIYVSQSQAREVFAGVRLFKSRDVYMLVKIYETCRDAVELPIWNTSGVDRNMDRSPSAAGWQS